MAAWCRAGSIPSNFGQRGGLAKLLDERLPEEYRPQSRLPWRQRGSRQIQHCFFLPSVPRNPINTNPNQCNRYVNSSQRNTAGRNKRFKGSDGRGTSEEQARSDVWLEQRFAENGLRFLMCSDTWMIVLELSFEVSFLSQTKTVRFEGKRS